MDVLTAMRPIEKLIAASELGSRSRIDGIEIGNVLLGPVHLFIQLRDSRLA